MDSRKEEFVGKMLLEALGSVGLPTGEYELFKGIILQDSDEVMLVVSDQSGEVVAANCRVWDAGNEICGSILLEVSRRKEILFFSYGRSGLSVMEVAGNA